MFRCLGSGAQRMRITLAAKNAEVWGSPIGHSRSPLLHNAAYEVLGIDAHYERRDVSEAGLAEALALVDSSWLGVSLTMPLKERITSLVGNVSPLVAELGSANTISWNQGTLRLDNTDVWGALQALDRGGIQFVEKAVVLGAGATARSVIRALSELQCSHLTLVSRNEARSRATADYARERGMAVEWRDLDSFEHVQEATLVVSTLPPGVRPSRVHPSLVTSASLFDVSYDPWPSALAAVWEANGKEAISGLSMLVFQALGQIRIFHHQDQSVALPGEDRVLDAMWSAVGRPA